MKNVRAACAAAVAVAAAAPAAADSLDRGALEELFGEPVATSATGAPQRATEAPVNMVIITQDEIRRSGAVDLPGVLERLASVDVLRTSAGQTDVSIRGYNTTLAPRLLVLVNGRQVYLDHYGMTNWNAIPVQMAEIRQIEVVTGPNTALFGFNAVGGVVNIITYDALNDDVDTALVRTGSGDYIAGSGVWTARLNQQVGVRASLGGFEHDTYANDDAAAANFFGTPSLGPIARTASLSGAYQVQSGWRVDAEATWSRSKRTERYADAIFPLLLETNSLRISTGLDTDWGLLSAQVFSNQADLGGLENQITVASANLVARPAPAHIFRLAGEVRRNSLGQAGSELAYDVYALSTMWNWRADEKLSLTAAARHDTLQLEREGVFVPSLSFTNDQYDQTFSEISFNLGGVYQLSERDALRFTAARGVGSPSLLDYGYQFEAPIPGGAIIVSGSPAVAPTIVYDAQVGWDHALPAFDGALRATLFWQRSEDLRGFASRTEILSFFPFVMALFPDAIGHSEMHGVELRLNGAHDRWRWDASYSWRSVEDELTVPQTVNQTAFERTSPEHVFTAGAAWTGDRIELSADARYTSETQQYGREMTLSGLYPVDAHWQLNARAAWRASESVTLELSGRNLLEPRTQSTGLSPVERAFYLTLNTRF